MGAISANVALSTAAFTSVYGPVPAGKSANVSINVCNRADAVAKVRVAFTKTPASPPVADYQEYSKQVTTEDPLVRTGEVLAAGEYVVIYTDGASCSARVSGYLETEPT